MNINKVRFSVADKIVVGSQECLTPFGTWKKDYLPQRYDKYNFEKHGLHEHEDKFYLGVALPSSKAPDDAFNGIICFDLDTRGEDKRNVWKPLINVMLAYNLINKYNMEYKGESVHLWFNIGADVQRQIVKSDTWKTSAKLYMTDDSSIDLIFGGKCIRTSNPRGFKGGYRTPKDNETGLIQFDKVPYMSVDLLKVFLEDEEDIFKSVSYKKQAIYESDTTTILPTIYGPIDNLKEVIESLVDIKSLDYLDSYSAHLSNIPMLATLSQYYQLDALYTYRTLFHRSKKVKDTGLDRSLSSWIAGGNYHKGVIEKVRNAILSVNVKQEDILF